MTNDNVRIFEDIARGKFEVVHNGNVVARYIVSRGTFLTPKGIELNQIYFNIHD